jgi:hypothetical protein
MTRTKIHVELPSVQVEWLQQKAADLATTQTEIVRRAVEKLMAASPITTSDEVNALVADWFDVVGDFNK